MVSGKISTRPSRPPDRVDATCLATVVMFKYIVLLPAGLWLPDDTALRETAEAVAVAEHCFAAPPCLRQSCAPGTRKAA